MVPLDPFQAALEVCPTGLIPTTGSADNQAVVRFLPVALHNVQTARRVAVLLQLSTYSSALGEGVQLYVEDEVRTPRVVQNIMSWWAFTGIAAIQSAVSAAHVSDKERRDAVASAVLRLKGLDESAGTSFTCNGEVPLSIQRKKIADVAQTLVNSVHTLPFNSSHCQGAAAAPTLHPVTAEELEAGATVLFGAESAHQNAECLNTSSSDDTQLAPLQLHGERPPVSVSRCEDAAAIGDSLRQAARNLKSIRQMQDTQQRDAVLQKKLVVKRGRSCKAAVSAYLRNPVPSRSAAARVLITDIPKAKRPTSQPTLTRERAKRAALRAAWRASDRRSLSLTRRIALRR